MRPLSERFHVCGNLGLAAAFVALGFLVSSALAGPLSCCFLGPL